MDVAVAEDIFAVLHMPPQIGIHRIVGDEKQRTEQKKNQEATILRRLRWGTGKRCDHGT